jgi:nitroreductase
VELTEALYTTRAMRRVAPDPVPEEVLASILDAAIRAPSGGNAQNWRMIAVTDEKVREAMAPVYRRAWARLDEVLYAGKRAAAEAAGDQATLRVLSSADWLAEHFEQVPLWIAFLSRNDPTGASIYPAVWSAMLAARGLGVGSCLTTVMGSFMQAESLEVLGVPPDKGWRLDAAVSFGYPLGRWGVAVRRPAHEVAYADRWGNDLGFTISEPRWRPAPGAEAGPGTG